VKSAKDGREGWVTTKGNAGSTYAKEAGRQYVVARPIPLQTCDNGDSAGLVRMLAEEEAIEVLEGPKELKTEAATRVRGRLVSSGQVGWVTLRSGNLKPWSSTYRCVRSIALTDTLEVKGTETLRTLEPGEAVEFLEGPRASGEGDTAVLRVRVRAERDGTVAWVTVSGSEGEPLLECVPTD